MRRGLSVISTRSEALSRFIGAYARLAKLPRPAIATDGGAGRGSSAWSGSRPG